ncbi:MAG: agmatinase [Vampirovibrionia bacterium]
MSTNNCKNTVIPFGIEEEYSQYETSKFHVISVPYAKTVSYIKGAENGPDAILKASEQVELYDIATESEPYLEGISYEEINTNVELPVIWEEMKEKVYKCINHNKFPVLLGGEHSITHGGIMGCKEKYNDLCILHIDAHCDLRTDYLGDKYSHACALRYAFDENTPIVQIGIRSAEKEEHTLIKNNPDKIKTFFANEEKLNNKEVLNNIKSKNVYLTIDIDGFDPSIIPHTGTPEPGGLGWYEVLKLLEELFKNYNVIAADIVELCPSETSTVSDFTAAKLLYKLFALKNKGL